VASVRMQSFEHTMNNEATENGSPPVGVRAGET